MESEAQREREVLAILREKDSMADVDGSVVEDVVEMPEPDAVQVEHKPDAARRRRRWFWRR